MMLSPIVRGPRTILCVAGRAMVGHLASTTAAVPESSVRAKDEIPGPKGWPILGNLPELIKTRENAGDKSIWHKYYMQYGPIYQLKISYMRSIPKVVVVTDPIAAATILRAEGSHPSRMIEENMIWIHRKENLHPSMLFSEGKEWKRIRSAAKKQIIPRRVGNFTPTLSKFAEQFGNHLYAIRNPEGYVMDVQPQVNNYTFQSAAYFVFSETLDVYSGKDERLKRFQDAAIQFIGSLEMIIRSPPLYKLWPTKPYRQYLQRVYAVQDIGRQIMKQKHDELKAAIERGIVDSSKAVGLLEQWLIEGNYTEEEALTQSIDMLAAGIDTTSNTLTFLLHEVSKNPDLQDKLHKEVISILGPSKLVTFEDVQKMQLVRGCAKETLRLYPSIPLVPRKIVEDVEIFGYHIPAETTVMLNFYSTSRSAQYFEDPLTFKPERWSREESYELTPFSYLPFGFGPRSCYGRRLAELEIHLLLAQVVRQYKLSTEQQSLKTRQATVMKPSEPVVIKITRR